MVGNEEARGDVADGDTLRGLRLLFESLVMRGLLERDPQFSGPRQFQRQSRSEREANDIRIEPDRDWLFFLPRSMIAEHNDA